MDMKPINITLSAQEARTLTCIFESFALTTAVLKIDVPRDVKDDMASILTKMVDRLTDQLVDHALDN